MADSLKSRPLPRLVIEYDAKVRFPKTIYLDPSAQVAEQEYGYLTTSVRKLLM